MRTDGFVGGRKNQINFKKNGQPGCGNSYKPGRITIVGIGPGSIEYMSLKAYDTIKKANIIVGYKSYIKMIEELVDGKELISTGMTGEVARAQRAIDEALNGKEVVVISSGDPGVYGMAGLVLELLGSNKIKIDVEIIPGITAANAIASSLGAPLMNDFVVISLSNLLTPGELIVKRLKYAASGDFVIIIYNPKSSKRIEQIVKAREIFLKYRNSKTPVGIVRNCKRLREEIIITNLDEMLDYKIDMLTTIIIGNSETYVNGKFMITPRGYQNKYDIY
ncbi:MAG: precorrin-3B C(17)-methyltransferase [Candidatus Nealsonbacteria bacterium]|nr:MAG: precorrin-3B C(17)-methyltransferase [Candidatus Nealsonbacteria bacterium]